MPFENNPNNKLSELRWEIKPGGKKEQKKQEFWVLLNLVPYLGFFLFIALAYSNYGSFFEILKSAIILMAIMAAVLYIRYKFGRDKERAYLLNEQGLTISRENKTKSYKWNDFECYYLYAFRGRGLENKDVLISTKDVGQITIKTEPQLEKINGNIFYLKKKPRSIKGKFTKTFVVVQAEPDNSAKVNEFLGKYLHLEKMTNTTDLGLVFYEFK